MTDKNINENKIDFISKFYCVVNKPLYFIFTIISIVPLVSLSTTLSYHLSSIMFTCSIVLYIVSMYVLYKVCYNNKEKQDKLNIYNIKTGKKIWFMVSTFILVLISVMMASVISIILVLNGIK